ncbi:hypothetical protein EST62_05870 [Chlorobaculum sp. 24CR]|uniref:putative porin n=1 Tax=Chlorobaculum sp. 24CR TaxID=2508878 RepID=UPI00100A9EC4|nr:putative porin [Chlorobaculum sp. 24CR]RXK87864.1 hypothetical protein EST62_05870 [Chlorobaculum sp. 24CR]
MKKTLFFVALATAMGFNNAEAVDWNWKGDFRYRYESSITENAEHSRDRHRIRLRFGVNPWINEELSVGLRLATGDPNDPTSRNQTLGDGFTAKDILLDEAYINYHPMFLDGNVNAVLGKRDVAKTLFVEKDLVWDSDVTLEGATVQYGKDIDGKQKSGFGAVVGWYAIDENGAEQDPYLLAFQGAYKGEASNLKYDIGVGYYDFVHFDLNNLQTGVAGANDDLGFSPEFNYIGKDFNIVEFFGSLGGDITETVPWKLYGQYAFNTASHDNNVNITDSERDAYLIGLKIGKAKNPGQLEGSAEYVRIEQDAVSKFSDADRNDGSRTNLKGVKLSATYQLIQNMALGVNYFNFKDIIGSDDTHHRVQADVVVKF